MEILTWFIIDVANIQLYTQEKQNLLENLKSYYKFEALKLAYLELSH